MLLSTFIKKRSAGCALQEAPSSLRRSVLVLAATVCVSLTFLAGCGGNSASKAAAGSITILDASGAPAKDSVVALATSLKLSMTPTDDKLNAGVDWTVTCSGNPVSGSVTGGACGTFAPAHTVDGGTTVYTAPAVIPINNSITLTATVTDNPGQSSSQSLTVISTPIAVQLLGPAQGPVPASLTQNTQISLTGNVANDPLGAGVAFTATCSSGACGSFNPPIVPFGNALPNSNITQAGTTYTAPSTVPGDGKVTITAASLTDTTKVATAVIDITTPAAPAAVSVAVAPTAIYAQTVGAGHSTSITAVVANDSAMAGVNWSVSCTNADCGTITSQTASGVAATYRAPNSIPTGGTVTITAASVTNPAVTASATANIVTATPIVVTQTNPPPISTSPGSPSMLTADVQNDTANLGVDWTATCSGGSTGCGTFSPAHTDNDATTTYTAPSAVPGNGGNVIITANATAASATNPGNPGVAVTTIVAQPPSIAITQQPPATLAAATQAPVSATVTNDVSPGGVAWSVQCSSTLPGGCGYVSPAQTASGATATYTAPPVAASGNTITITATSIANTSATASSTAITINPNTTLSVSFVPFLPSQLAPGQTVNLIAAVANDASNSGVDWQVCTSGCGFFTITPAIPANPAAGAPNPIPAVQSTNVSGWSNGLAISYTAPAQMPSTGAVVVTAVAHADSKRANSGTITISQATTGPVLNGSVMSGTQPVVGSSVALFAAGVSGYASASSQVASATTDKNGNFTIPATYTCPAVANSANASPAPASQMYLVATGGAVGSNTANATLSLMTALGSCSNLSSTPVVINEVTTVASTYAAAPFAANDELNGNPSALYLGTSSSNLVGLANAFAAVNNLVDITTGRTRYNTPAGNAAVPYVTLNTLADALNACTATSGGVEGDGSACGNLLTAADTLAGLQIPNSIGPANTLQAIFNIAQHPVGNYGYQLSPSSINSLASSTSPFQPILTVAPNDFSLSLNYTNGGGLTSATMAGSFAVDGSGNLWITDTAAGSAIELNAVGAAVSPSTGFSAGGPAVAGGPLAIDANENVWISGNGKLIELTPLGTAAPGSPYKGADMSSTDIAIDQLSNLWVANNGGLSEFTNLGVPVSINEGLANSGVTPVTGVGIDTSDNVWVGNGVSNNIALLTNPGGNVVVNSQPNRAGMFLPQLAADGSGDMWGATNGNVVCEAKPFGGLGTFMASCYDPLLQSSQTNPLFSTPTGLAFDGAGILWIGSQGGTPPLPGVLPFSPSQISVSGLSKGITSPFTYASASLSAGTLRVAVDGSGNVWVLLAGGAGVTEYVGAATPVVTPIALGLKNNKLAAKP